MHELLLAFGLICLGYSIGSQRERQHYKALIVRERTFQDIGIRVNRRLPMDAEDTQMITACVVIASDHFKSVATKVKNMVGGGLSAQEILMARAKREALVRLKEKAARFGAKEVFGFRTEMVAIDGKGVEVFVYGTAVKR